MNDTDLRAELDRRIVEALRDDVELRRHASGACRSGNCQCNEPRRREMALWNVGLRLGLFGHDAR